MCDVKKKEGNLINFFVAREKKIMIDVERDSTPSPVALHMKVPPSLPAF